jgi:hypothetical protein
VLRRVVVHLHLLPLVCDGHACRGSWAVGLQLPHLSEGGSSRTHT